MLSRTQRVSEIARNWALRFSTTVLNNKDLVQFHYECRIAGVNPREVLNKLDDYEIGYVDGGWVIVEDLKEAE